MRSAKYEAHPLADLAEALALFIHSYEETHARIREATGPEVLRSLWKRARPDTGLDSIEIGPGGQRKFSPGERELNILDRSATWLSDSESPAVFIVL